MAVVQGRARVLSLLPACVGWRSGHARGTGSTHRQTQAPSPLGPPKVEGGRKEGF